MLHKVNINTFYKIKWNSTCEKEMDIFHFYESLQHMASTCGIPMRDLHNINESNGVCPLTPDNCENYETVYKLMKGAIFHKINDKSLWKNYDHGWNLVTSNLSDCDGFEVMYDVLSEILPTLNINTTKSTKIPRPVYTAMDDDNIYKYVNAYNAFLKFEELGPSKRRYTPYEVAVSIANDLENEPHNRFEKGIDHVRQQLQRSTDGSTVPKSISINKIAKTICKFSPAYKVGEYKTPTCFTPDTPVINTLNRPPRRDFTPTAPKQRRPRDMSMKCKICGQIGHNQESEDGCIVFAKWMMCQQASTRLSESEIKTNTRKFFKKMKQRQHDDRQSSKFQKQIKSLEDQNVDAPSIINALKILQDQDYYSSDSDSDEE